MVPPYKGMSPSLKKEGKSDTCCNVDEPQGHYARGKKPDTSRQPLGDRLTGGSGVDIHGRGTGTGLKEGGKVSVWAGLQSGRRSVLGMDGVMGAQPRERLHLTPLNQALKTGADRKLHVTCICHN